MIPNPTHQRVVVDTNVLIAAALAVKHKRFQSTAYRVFEMMIEDDTVENLVSQTTLYELADKSQDQRFALSGAFIIDFVDLVAQASTIVAIRGLSYPCRDPKDCKFIETAVNGRCNFLITHDRDLHDPKATRELSK